jgi:hypothetical protein
MTTTAQNAQDIWTLNKTHSARIIDLRAQQKTTAQQAAATAAVANAQQVTTQVVNASTNMVGPNGQPLYGYSGGASMFPLSNDGNTGSSWATGERGFINDLNAAVNFIWAVLLDTGITT